MKSEQAKRLPWSAAVGFISFACVCTAFAVALCLALLCEFIATASIGEWVDDDFASMGARICFATSLLAFVVGFGVAQATVKSE